jgi:hypothetical protein
MRLRRWLSSLTVCAFAGVLAAVSAAQAAKAPEAKHYHICEITQSSDICGTLLLYKHTWKIEGD